MRLGGVGAILLAFLLVPTASAAVATGTLVTPERAHLDSAASLDTHPLALYWEDLGADARFELRAERVVVHRYEYESQDLGILTHRVFNRTAIYPLTDVSISLEEIPAGWLGIAAHGTSLAAQLHPTGGTDFGAVDSGIVGHAPTGNGPAEDPAAPGYTRELSAPHVQLEAALDGQLSGAGWVKLMGSTISIAAAENTTRISTGGSRGAAGLPTTEVDRWVLLTFEAADISIAASTRAVVASPTIDALGVTRLQVSSPQGTVVADGTSYTATGRSATFAGSLDLHLAPVGEAGILGIAVGGDLAGSTVAGAPLAIPARTSWWPPALLLAAAVAATHAVITWRQRRARVPVETLVDLADMRIEAEDFAAALAHLKEAQRTAPTSVRLHLDEGFLHEKLDDLPAALAAYERAQRLAPDDAEVAFLFGRALARARDPSAAASQLARAVQLMPSLCLEIEEDSELARLGSITPLKETLRNMRGSW